MKSSSFISILCLTRFLPVLSAILVCTLALAAETTRVACVGNSLTDGTGLAGRDTACYPARLQQLLGPTYQVLNFGVAGATMLKNGNEPYWTFGIAAFNSAMTFLPNSVVIELGTNDSKSTAANDNWPPNKDEFAGDYEAMVDTFANLSSHPEVWACYPPPAYSTASDIDSTVIHYEILPRIKTVVLAKGISLIDLFATMSGKSNLFPDGIHPNAEGYLLIAQKVYRMFMKDTINITQRKNWLEAPQDGSLYQWYYQGGPIAAASGGAGEVFIAKDTGSYKVSVGQSTTTDDILVTKTVHVSLSDIGSWAAQPHVLPASLFSHSVQGSVFFYHPDGRMAASLFLPEEVSPHFLARIAPLVPSGLYLVKADRRTFKLVIP